MSAAPDARGLKRVCVSCGIRFYDLNKRPVHCPNCETEFSGEIKLKSRRGRSAAADLETEAAKAKANPAANDDQNSDIEARDEGVVSLEDVEALENADADDDADDIDVEDDDIGSLEEIEEEGDIDVPDDKGKE